jgi:hypothetical protein
MALMGSLSCRQDLTDLPFTLQTFNNSSNDILFNLLFQIMYCLYLHSQMSIHHHKQDHFDHRLANRCLGRAGCEQCLFQFATYRQNNRTIAAAESGRPVSSKYLHCCKRNRKIEHLQTSDQKRTYENTRNRWGRFYWIQYCKQNE